MPITTANINQDNIRRLACEIVKLAEGNDPREYLGALELASSMIIRAVWHKSQWPATLDAHLMSVRQLTFDPEGKQMKPGKGANIHG